jgi:hypothetical protein
MHARSIALAFAISFAIAATAHAANSPDWPSVASVETIQIRTTDADGSPRERTIWLLVHDGQGYIPEGATYDAVMAGMREKYGFQDMLISPLRALGASPRVLRLDPRAGMPMGTP